MYCPNCEFEIKQEVAECPICGGELTEFPADGEDTTIDSGSDTQNRGIKKPRDTCISDLILDAKHELDSLDSVPASQTRPVEPLSASLDFESLLSDDSTETGQPTAGPFTPEPQEHSILSEAPQTDEDSFSPDNAAIPFREKGDLPVMDGSSFGEKEPPENLFSDDKLFLDETSPPSGTDDTNLFIDEPNKEPPENLFSDDKLFLDETTAPANTADASLFIDEQGEARPEVSQAPEISPPREQTSDEPWSLQEMSEPETTDFIPETQEDHSNNAPVDSPAFLNIERTESTGTTEKGGNGSTGSRSKKALVLILLLGVLFLAGVYAFNEFLPQDSELAQIKKEILAGMPAWVPWATPQEPLTPAKPKSRRLSENLQEKVTAGEAIENDPQQISASQPPPQPLPSYQPGETTDMAPDNTQQQIPAPQTKPEEPVEAKEPGNAAPADTQQAANPQPAPLVSAGEKTEMKSDTATFIPENRETASASEGQQSPARLYTIHVASFKSNQVARKEVDQLIDLGFDAYSETVDLGAKGVWHRVKVGHFASRAEADQTVKSIRQKKPDVSPLIYKTK
jgi:cell division protein FtsN